MLIHPQAEQPALSFAIKRRDGKRSVPPQFTRVGGQRKSDSGLTVQFTVPDPHPIRIVG
jgi:hypothetical protein